MSSRDTAGTQDGQSIVRTKVGLLGAGYILDSHANALLAVPGRKGACGCGCVARASSSRGCKVWNPSRLGIDGGVGESDCDVIHVLLPPALHVDAAFAMVDAGKSVFLEKPMGLDSGACAELSKRAEPRGALRWVSIIIFCFLARTKRYAPRSRQENSAGSTTYGSIGISRSRSFNLDLLIVGCCPHRPTCFSKPARI